MEILISLIIGVLVAGGAFLLLRTNLVSVVLGLTLLSYAVNVFLFAMGRLQGNAAPILEAGNISTTDPLPQALVLTAIVIGFAMTAFTLALALRAHRDENPTEREQ